MAVFSTNQARQLYVVNLIKTELWDGTENAGTIKAVSDKGADNSQADKYGYFQYKGADTVLRSDLINVDSILDARVTFAEEMAYDKKSVQVSLSSDVNGGEPVPGQDYILRLIFRQYVGMSDEDQYQKYGMVHAHSSMDASDFYKTLDKNRVKKNCEYALLVSNLELNQDNDLPIRKVSEYKNMYVVRPGYMVTFLNLITSLSNKFKDLILKDYEYSIEIQKQSDFKLEYEKLKNTYLDKPLEGLKSKIENIQDQSNKIKNCASAIDKELDSIIHNYIEGIIDKLDKFDAKMITNYKKLNK